MSDQLIINLPFAGFYNSYYSQELDSVEEREADHFAEQYGGDAGDYADFLFRATDYQAAYCEIAQRYVESFGIFASDALGLPLGLEFEKMTSPREYNFETDRVFAYISADTVKALHAKVNPATLQEVISERFTSRSGFYSSYSNCLDDWASDPTEWDHNELCTLLIAALRDVCTDVDGDRYELQVFFEMAESEVFYEAHSCAVDWAKFEELRTDAIRERIEEIEAEGLMTTAAIEEVRTLQEQLSELDDNGAQMSLDLS